MENICYYIKVTFLHTESMRFKIYAPNDTTAIIEVMEKIQQMDPVPFVDTLDIIDRE